MPALRCTNEECGHTWSERSRLAIGSDCPECGEPAEPVGVDDDGPVRPKAPAPSDYAHPAHARKKARQVARERGFVKPPVVVHKIARDLGFEIHASNRLGDLSGRLVGKVIEVNANESTERQRFSVAHELGHHFLGTRHGDGRTAEREANAFAGELLVPGPMLREAMATTTAAPELRRRFAVSRQVLRIAAEQHKLDDRLTED